MSKRGINGHLDRAAVAATLRMFNGLFPPGTPVATNQLLSGVSRLFDACASAMMIGRVEPNQPIVVPVDTALHTTGSEDQQAWLEGAGQPRLWDQDPAARVLRRRVDSHPGKPFTYSLLHLSRRHRDSAHLLFGARFLNSVGWTHDCCSVQWMDRNSLSILCIYRNTASARPFSRADARLLAMLHDTVRDRVIEVRGRRLREEIPKSTRQTFALLLSGYTEKEIARLTHRSPNTVHDHVKRVYQHFNVGSRAQLLSRFVDIERLNGHGL